MRVYMPVSVIIPLYNKSYSVARCVNSIARQTKLPNEIIVINDGSTDNSIQQLKATIAALPSLNIRVYDQENCGVAAARNRGVGEATNSLIALIDADDEWDPLFIERMADLVEKFPGASLYSCNHYKQYGTNKSVQASELGNGFEGYIDNFFTIKNCQYLVNSSSVVFRKDAFLQVGGFPEKARVTEDVFVWFRLISQFQFAYINQPLSVIHRTKDMSRESRRNAVPYIVSYFRLNRFEFEGLNKSQKKFLFNIYRNHVLVSLANGYKYEALMRWSDGIRLFKWRGSALVVFFAVPATILSSLHRLNRHLSTDSSARG